ncbi:mediator of RNA polymerase II transcription subunit 15-like [Cimex lectularius]|uniref:Uncharacterized protein n=1 Tax=Cimex lectularius TaxID=79782 RepID=A0A8I6RP58_CIMLE|nr:mediator of RNA polymerase II transcription subunit 15-like [Cimex lectularius]
MHPIHVLLLGFVLGVLAYHGSADRNVLQKRGVETTRKINGQPTRRRTRPNHSAPPYAVQMEPLVKYSQRDPLYHQKINNNSIESTSRGDHEPEPSNNIAEVASPYGYEQHPYHPHYYQEPEPIIEIIIKESNESLPAPTPPSTLPPPPSTKEPVHVFYVKYKKNPYSTGKDGEADVIYEKPVPALTSHQSDIIEEDHHTPVQTEPPSYNYATAALPPSTTLRTIIRPDSEIYHGSGLKVTFENPSHHQYDRSEVELDESASEPEVVAPEQDEAQKRDSVEIPQKTHQYKRQQGPYIPQYQPQQPSDQQYHQPPLAPQQFVNPQARHPGAQGSDVRHPPPFTRGNHKHSFPQQPSKPTFRPQHTAAIFQRPQQFRESVNQGPPQHLGPNQHSLNHQPPNQPPQQHFPDLTHKSRPQHPPPQTNFKQNGPPTLNYQPNNFADSNQQRQQFQPTLAAQIEQYQQHKQFLYQQNLRHQALQQQQEQQQNSQLNHRPNPTPSRPPTSQTQIEYSQYKSQQPIHVQSSVQFQRNQQQFVHHQKEALPKPQQYTFSPQQQPVHNDVHSSPKTSYVTLPPQSQSHPSFQPPFSSPSSSQQPSFQQNERPSFSNSHQTNTKPPPFSQNQQPVFGQKQTYYQNHQSQVTQNKDVRITEQSGKSSPSFSGGEIVKSISQLEAHQIQPAQKPSNKLNYNQHKEEQTINDYNHNSQIFTSPDSFKTQHQQQSNQQDYRLQGRYKPQETYSSQQSYKPQSSYQPQDSYTPQQSHQTQERNKPDSYKPENHRYQPVYTSSTPKPRPTFTSRTSTAVPHTKNKVFSLVPSSTESTDSNEDVYESSKEKQQELAKKEDEKKKANLAVLPDEVPDDLRQQLLSSGILGNADIQILDYDKVGDIPIESLPPEALENFYGAASDPVPSIVKPDSPPSQKQVEMKVVRYDPNTKEGQSVADTYVREDATQLDPVVLNDTRYNRYLPLKVSGTQFPIPDVPQLKGRIVNSVVVLAPVDYDFIQTQDQTPEIDRSGKAVQVQSVRFLAGDSLKTVVKSPTMENYKNWLEKEKETPTEKQSVVLLVTRSMEEEKDKDTEIYMYDISTENVSKLRGELSSAFVEVAQSNSESEEIEELAPQITQTDTPASQL